MAEEKKPEVKKESENIRINMDKYKTITVILAVLLIISVIYTFIGTSTTNMIVADTNTIKEKVEAYIEQNPNIPEATLSDLELESGLYKGIVTIQGEETVVFISKDGKYLFPGAIPLETEEPSEPSELCAEDGKPIIRLFSTTWCSHCGWIKETFDSVVKEYVDSGEIVAYHWELDTNDDTLTTEVETVIPEEEMAVYEKYNPGGSIPTFVFGCKYTRIGNGYEQTGDLAAEEAEFRAIIEALIAGEEYDPNVAPNPFKEV